MKRLTQTLPILLAAFLQIVPMVRNLFTGPSVGASFAFILRWGATFSAALESVDAVSGATNYFTSPSSFIGSVSLAFTNNLTLKTSGSDSGSVATITSNGVSVLLTTSGQATTFGMPAGLTFMFYDSGFNNGVYDAIYGTPTAIGTNIFTVTMSYPGQTSITTNITISIVSGGSRPIITNAPVNTTVVAGGTASFSVVAGGSTPLSYQWIFDNAITLLNATNSSLSLTGVRASQRGAYTVTISNSFGTTNSRPAILFVTNPPPPVINLPSENGIGQFQFSFVPVTGLTNSVQANSDISGGVWSALTNIPPPASGDPITVEDPLNSSNRFYRVMVIP